MASNSFLINSPITSGEIQQWLQEKGYEYGRFYVSFLNYIIEAIEWRDDDILKRHYSEKQKRIVKTAEMGVKDPNYLLAALKDYAELYDNDMPMDGPLASFTDKDNKIRYFISMAEAEATDTLATQLLCGTRSGQDVRNYRPTSK